jgi:hypothetical protein
MDYRKFAVLLNAHLFEGDKINLLKKLAQEPSRFVGLFRSSKPKTKVIQYLLQSREIRFGDAMEEVIGALLSDLGYSLLPLSLQGKTGRLSLDLHFEDIKREYVVEMKVRDDHDSTKKKGQADNFEEKVLILDKTSRKELIGVVFFLDPSMNKNANFYQGRRSELSKNTKAQLHLCYGPEFFDLIGHLEMWKQLVSWLERWQNEIPDFPEVNFDLNPKESFDEIKDIDLRIFEMLFGNSELWERGVMKVLFPHGATLRLLCDFFDSQVSARSRRLAKTLCSLMSGHYPAS